MKTQILKNFTKKLNMAEAHGVDNLSGREMAEFHEAFSLFDKDGRVFDFFFGFFFFFFCECDSLLFCIWRVCVCVVILLSCVEWEISFFLIFLD